MVELGESQLYDRENSCLVCVDAFFQGIVERNWVSDCDFFTFACGVEDKEGVLVCTMRDRGRVMV
jgi:hypothetical protein